MNARRRYKNNGLNLLALAIVVVALAGVGYYVWCERNARIAAEEKAKEAELNIGLEAARMIGAKFEKAAAIKVETIKGRVVGRAEFQGKIFKSSQETILPVTVDYFIEIGNIDRNSYRWNSEAKVLTIDLPDVTVAEPNIDEAKGITRQHGVFISREASLALARQVSQRSEAKAKAFANEAENLKTARENARAVVTNLVVQSLKAAGMTNVKCAVSFPWEPKAYLNKSPEQWDLSRRPEEIMQAR